MFDYEKEVGNTSYQEEWLRATKCLSCSYIGIYSSEGWKVDTSLGILPVLSCSKDEPGKYLKPHKESETRVFRVSISTVEFLTCPEEKILDNILDDPLGLGYTCALCGRSFGSDKSHCKRHIKNVHSKTSTAMACDFCHKHYKNYDTLKAHQRATHGVYSNK